MDSSRRRSQPCSSVFFFMRHSALLYERRPRFLPFFFLAFLRLLSDKGVAQSHPS